jgi:hypothetical protein
MEIFLYKEVTSVCLKTWYQSVLNLRCRPDFGERNCTVIVNSFCQVDECMTIAHNILPGLLGRLYIADYCFNADVFDSPWQRGTGGLVYRYPTQGLFSWFCVSRRQGKSGCCASLPCFCTECTPAAGWERLCTYPYTGTSPRVLVRQECTADLLRTGWVGIGVAGRHSLAGPICWIRTK